MLSTREPRIDSLDIMSHNWRSFLLLIYCIPLTPCTKATRMQSLVSSAPGRNRSQIKRLRKGQVFCYKSSLSGPVSPRCWRLSVTIALSTCLTSSIVHDDLGGYPEREQRSADLRPRRFFLRCDAYLYLFPLLEPCS